jgi:hypothetical protein
MAWWYRYAPAVQMNGNVHTSDPPSQAKCYRAISADALTEGDVACREAPRHPYRSAEG